MSETVGRALRLVWGGVADAIGVRWTLVVASATFVPGLLVVHWLGLPVIDRREMKVVPRPHPVLAVFLSGAGCGWARSPAPGRCAPSWGGDGREAAER